MYPYSKIPESTAVAFRVHTQNVNGINTYRNKVIRSQAIQMKQQANQENLQLHHKVGNVMVKLPKSALAAFMYHAIDKNKIPILNYVYVFIVMTG